MVEIRACCFKTANDWCTPTGEEVRELLRMAGEHQGQGRPYSGSQVADLLGLGKGGGRTVRRWIAEDTHIPYASWAILCHAAGIGHIWQKTTDKRGNQDDG